ncbi:type II toxin-antitoxin system RelE/ParE family toxin [Rheinheimera marina]|uniref:Type II toxin-antitoxin system RelE/ParE family toxin n=2 Tax=Rheinheimera marina TaxID=1774958 RepID=A0ABV9JN70_9GAMM
MKQQLTFSCNYTSNLYCRMQSVSLGGIVLKGEDAMQTYKSKWFSKWAEQEGLTDCDLYNAVQEITAGLMDADLGGHVIKKRVGLRRQGKRGGARTLLAVKHGDKAFFIFGFAKSQQDNISRKELNALKLLAKNLLAYTAVALNRAIQAGELIEVKIDE